MQRMRGMHGPRPVTTAGADQHPAAPGTPDRERRPWPLMAVLSVAQFMVILDATVVNVALPSITRSLSFTAGRRFADASLARPRFQIRVSRSNAESW